MLFQAIKDFRQRTIDQYKEEEEKEMAQWKKDVMTLHEESDYLFYCDDMEPEIAGSKTLVIRGEHVKGRPTIPMPVYLYDGEGSMLGQGLLMSDSEEKEEKRRGFLRSRKNEFLMKLLVLHEENVSEMEEQNYRRLLRSLYINLSLISDKRMNFKGSDA